MDVLEGVGVGGGLVGAKADDPGKAEGEAGLVAVALLDGVEGDLDDDFGGDGADGAVAAGRDLRKWVPMRRISSSVRPE